jgi:hypothetical protein
MRRKERGEGREGERERGEGREGEEDHLRSLT